MSVTGVLEAGLKIIELGIQRPGGFVLSGFGGHDGFGRCSAAAWSLPMWVIATNVRTEDVAALHSTLDEHERGDGRMAAARMAVTERTFGISFLCEPGSGSCRI